MLKSTTICILILTFKGLYAQNASYCQEIAVVVNLVESAHYQPKPLNDSLSHAVYDLFLKSIDDNESIFLQDDIKNFSKDQYNIDDFIRDRDCSFLKKYALKYLERLEEAEQILEKLKTKKFNYHNQDSLYFLEDKESYFADKASRIDYWERHVKYNILKQIVETESDLKEIKDEFESLELIIKERVIANELCLLSEKKQLSISLENWIGKTFLNAYLSVQDPNSMYLTSSEKTIFEDALNNTQFTFGIYTEKKSNGDITISYIIPGSPAYKNADIDENDKIISLSSSNKVLETYCVSSETVDDFINDNQHNELDFKIKKRNGQVKTIRLKKNKVNNNTNTITGFVIENKEKIGYIEIPSFYTDMESINGLGVANDVAKQIYKLQRENISALIIDLRYNGGGSMKEAAELAGMFIDRGPVAITSHRDSETYTMRDPNRGVIFYKPVVVLVSQFSASASELFAGVLQDYNSAVIVGSTTHGKATVQQIIPLGTSTETSFVKLTVGEFFRVSGKSHQKTGIDPDISLPSIYDHLDTQETYRPFAIPNGRVEVSLPHRQNPKIPLEILSERSQQRLENNTLFDQIAQINTILVNDYFNKEGAFPLTLDFVYDDLKRYEALWKDYGHIISQEKDALSVFNTSSTESIISYNEDEIAFNQIKRDNISKDPYVKEAVNIALDMITNH